MITFEVEVEEVAPAANHDPMLIDALVKLYHEKLPPSFQSYQEGRQAGIRYALLALNTKIEGINS